MQRFELREGQIGMLGGVTFGVVEARAGRMIAVAKTELWESDAELLSMVDRLRRERREHTVDETGDQVDNL